GKVNVPAGSEAETGVPLIVPATVAGSVSENVSDEPVTTLNVGATVSIANGTSSETVASGSGAGTTAVYWPSGNRTPAEVPSHPTVWKPGPSCPVKSVAITAPARCTVTWTETFCESAKPNEIVSEEPSAFGEKAAGVAASPDNVRSMTRSADWVDVSPPTLAVTTTS